MANTGQYDSQTNIETEDYEREIFVRPEAAVIYGGSVVNSVNGQVGDVVLTTSDLENTSDYQTGAQVQNAIAGKQDKLTAGSGLNLDGTILSVDTNIIATVQDVTDEATIRENSDANLQGQIDALLDSKQNVIADLPQIRSGAEAGATAVQPEDLARIATTGSYTDLNNKPTIPTVNDGTLTIQRNGSTVASFTANSSINRTANISVPTATSQLTNDSGYTTNTGTITSVKMNGNTVATSGEANLGTVITDVSEKQNITDNALETNSKTVPGAINEVNSIAKGANQALSFANYSAMVTHFNAQPNDKYQVGQNIMVVTLEVPDLWISGIESTSSTYTYTTDEAFTTAMATNGYVQVGYYKLSALETQKVDLTNYVTNTDYASNSTAGVIRTSSSYGTAVSGSGVLNASTLSYESYSGANNTTLVGKGTLENVITGKGLVSSTDYATSKKGGVIKYFNSDGLTTNNGALITAKKTYAQYNSSGDWMFIGKGTLENVITGKGLDLKQLSTFDRTKTQVLKNINGTLTWVDE